MVQNGSTVFIEPLQDLPLVVHVLAALTTGVTGVITFSRPKRGGHHPGWGVRYLWAYTVVFLTAIILSDPALAN